jgi:hypothetical protein
MRESNPHLLLNSGIEPEFNLFWLCEGNRTLKFKTRYVGDGYKNGKHFKILRHLSSICLGIKEFLCRESNPKNLFGDSKEFLEDNGVDLQYCL